MPTSFKVTVPLNIPRSLLWRIRSSRALCAFLVSNGALQRLDRTPAVADTSPGASPTARTRRQTYVPANLAIPDAVRSLFDDSYIEVVDEQSWDDAAHPFVQRSNIRSGVLAEYIATTLTLTVEPDRDNRIATTTTVSASATGGGGGVAKGKGSRRRGGSGLTPLQNDREEEDKDEATEAVAVSNVTSANSSAVPSPAASSRSSLPSTAAASLSATLPEKLKQEQQKQRRAGARAAGDQDRYDDNNDYDDDMGYGCLHTLAGQCSVSIPFLGYYVEQAVVANMRDFYAKYPAHFEQFLDMVVSKYGDGTRASLPSAIDNLLAEEKEEEDKGIE